MNCATAFLLLAVSGLIAVISGQLSDTAFVGDGGAFLSHEEDDTNDADIKVFRGLKVGADGVLKEEVTRVEEECASPQDLSECLDNLEECETDADDIEELKLENEDLAKANDQLKKELKEKIEELSQAKASKPQLVGQRYWGTGKYGYNRNAHHEPKHPKQEKGDWSEFKHACIKHHNIKYFRAGDHNECLSTCEKMTDFQCCSVDYHFGTRLCSMSAETSLSVPKSFYEPCYRRGWSYAERSNQGCINRTAVRASPTRTEETTPEKITKEGEPKPQWMPVESGCIKDHNNKVFIAQTFSSCRDACEKSTTFDCCSIDYNFRTKVCDLSVETMASSASVYYSPCYKLGWSYTERIDSGKACAKQKDVSSQVRTGQW